MVIHDNSVPQAAWSLLLTPQQSDGDRKEKGREEERFLL